MPAFESKKLPLLLGRLLLLTLMLGACGGKTVDLDRQASTTPADDADVVVNAAAGTLWNAGPYLLWTDVPLVSDRLTPLQGCRKDDCTHTLTAYVTLGSQNVATSSTHVGFVGDGPTSCPLSGCEGHPTRVFDDSDAIEVALDDDYLYWLSEDSLYRCPVDGCGAMLPSVIASRQTATEAGVLVAGGNAYWRVDSELRRTRVDGSEPVAIAATSIAQPNYLSLLTVGGGSTLYYLGANNHLYACSLPTCTEPTDLVATEREKFSLRADERGAFWLEQDDAVHFCEASGCGSAPAQVTPVGVYAFAIDSEYVYWSKKVTLPLNDRVPSSSGDTFTSGENIHRTAR